MHSTLEGYTIEYTDKNEFLTLKKEIFRNEIYSIDLDKEDPLIIDAGSHIGMSILYWKKKYSDAKIICFEPNPILLPILKNNIDANGLRDVEIINKAVDTHNGSEEFYIDIDQTWLSTGGYNRGSWSGSMKTKAIIIETINIAKVIDSCLVFYNTDHVDLLKLDIEGYEYTLIRYLDRKNKLQLINNLIFEYHPMGKNSLVHLKELLSIVSKVFKKIEFIQEGKEVYIDKMANKELLLVKCSM